jgi:hypothetical protein
MSRQELFEPQNMNTRFMLQTKEDKIAQNLDCITQG